MTLAVTSRGAAATGRDQGLPAWIAGSIDGILATVERLAIEDHPGSAEFLDRMRWLPALPASLIAQASSTGQRCRHPCHHRPRGGGNIGGHIKWHTQKRVFAGFFETLRGPILRH
jgi:hypothetical protein